MSIKKIKMVVSAAGEKANYPAGSVYEVGKGIPSNLADAFVNAKYAEVIEEAEVVQEKKSGKTTPDKAKNKEDSKKAQATEKKTGPKKNLAEKIFGSRKDSDPDQKGDLPENEITENNEEPNDNPS